MMTMNLSDGGAEFNFGALDFVMMGFVRGTAPI